MTVPPTPPDQAMTNPQTPTAEEQAQALEGLAGLSTVLTAINSDVNREALKAGAAALRASVGQTTQELGAKINISMSAEELDWVEHAAGLRNISVIEYVRRAINLSLRQEGVDALLLSESDDV